MNGDFLVIILIVMIIVRTLPLNAVTVIETIYKNKTNDHIWSDISYL